MRTFTKNGLGWRSDFAASAAISITQITIAISLAALVFSGQNAPLFARGALAFLFAAAVSTALTTLRTGLQPLVTGPPNTVAVVITTTLASSPQSESTVFVFLALVSFTTGLSYFLLGRFNGGQVVRFLPHPVLTAYIGGIGWLLIQGGLGLMRNSPTNYLTPFTSSFWADWPLWGAGALLALALVAARERSWPPVTSSVLVAGSIVLFFVVGLRSSPLSSIENSRWVIGARQSDISWHPLSLGDVRGSEWSVLVEWAPGLFACVFVALAGMLLNSSSIALSQQKRSQPDVELQAIGLANMVSAPLAGLVTHHVAAPTALAQSLRASGKRFAIATAGLMVAAGAIAGDWVSLLPRPVAGGVLASLGIGLFTQWIRQGLSHQSLIDKVLSTVIVATMVASGVLAGVAAGIVAAIVIFVVRYSRIGPIKRQLDGSSFRSNVDRQSSQNAMLDQVADSTLILLLHGYLFFGSVKQIEDTVHAALEDSSNNVKFLVLGFSDVTGLDASAQSAFAAIKRLTTEHGVTIVWSGTSNKPWTDALPTSHAPGAPDLDRAMAWCEDQLLKTTTSDEVSPTIERSDEDLHDAFVTFGTKITVDANETLLRSGEDANSMFYVAEGTLTAWLERDDVLVARFRQMGPGSLVGEVAFATGQTRTATVIADSDAAVWKLDREAMDTIITTKPKVGANLYAQILRRVSERLSSTNETVAELLRGER